MYAPASNHTIPHINPIQPFSTRTRLERVPLADAELGGVGAPKGVERAVGAGQRHGVVAPARHLLFVVVVLVDVVLMVGGRLVPRAETLYKRRPADRVDGRAIKLLKYLGDGLPVQRLDVLQQLLVLHVAQPQLPVVVQPRRPHLRVRAFVRWVGEWMKISDWLVGGFC